ncbi:hypothetical protein BGAL_0063g00210 [Botrytis galanthina]|uniref:Uncharacterized protein n=1 Tax=Botrytis galanthina TaxID=278940 RepID=A0A4S8RHC4_9HELO|nr:hypothetical protein BGAL_0063g00210 [Botrytis galanthina]
MCNTVLVKGPCWCDGNNGKRVTVGQGVKICKYVELGGLHDEYEPRFREIEIVEGNCDKCPLLEAEARRLDTEAREREWMENERAEARKVEAQRVEARRVAEERAAQVAAQGGKLSRFPSKSSSKSPSKTQSLISIRYYKDYKTLKLK